MVTASPSNALFSKLFLGWKGLGRKSPRESVSSFPTPPALNISFFTLSRASPELI